MDFVATPPATPPRKPVLTPSSTPYLDPMAGTAKGAGMHPSFSSDHYQSPSHAQKLARLKLSSPSPSTSATTPRTFGRSVSAPASTNMFGSPAVVAGDKLQDIMEENLPSTGLDAFDPELAGANRAERTRIKSLSSAHLFGSSNSHGALQAAFGGKENQQPADFEGDGFDPWLAGDAEADSEPPIAGPSILLPPVSLPPPVQQTLVSSPKLQAPLHIRSPLHVPTEEEASDQIFDNAVEDAVMHSRPVLNLIAKSIVRIPMSIRDLGLVTAIGPSGGDLAASSHKYSSPRTPKRIASSPSALCPSPMGVPPSASRSGQFLVHLALNQISVLPLYLFELTNLTVLTLRSNNIEEIPPAIGRLVHLVELNISNNKIQFLPSEIAFLTSLDRLFFAGNPWLAPPSIASSPGSATSTGAPTSPSRTRQLGPLTTPKSAVPSLTELCLRRLCPSSPADRPQLTASHLASPFLARSPYYREKLEDRESWQQLALGRCAGCGNGFFEPAEERTEWTTLPGAEGGGKVPIKWRGCTGGCLAFLEAPLGDSATQ